MDRETVLLRLQKWSVAHWDDWMTICGLGGAIGEEEFLRLWGLLKQNEFYEIPLVLFTCNYAAIQKRAEHNLRDFIKKKTEQSLQEGLFPSFEDKLEHPFS